ncbi:MAG: response regulator [Candidatus Sulfotelmatobacter sp.]
MLIRCEGWQPEIFASAQEFLSRPRVLVPSCLILDGSLPGLNGLDLQKRIASDRIDMPIIFITGHGDIPMSVHPKRHRAQPGHTWSRGGATGAPRVLRVAHASRKASHGFGSRRPVE